MRTLRPKDILILKSSILPVAQKTYLFKGLYIDTITRNPKTVGLFGYR